MNIILEDLLSDQFQDDDIKLLNTSLQAQGGQLNEKIHEVLDEWYGSFIDEIIDDYWLFTLKLIDVDPHQLYSDNMSEEKSVQTDELQLYVKELKKCIYVSFDKNNALSMNLDQDQYNKFKRKFDDMVKSIQSIE